MKLVAIATSKAMLYALDEQGQLWLRYYSTHTGGPVWVKCELPEEPEKP